LGEEELKSFSPVIAIGFLTAFLTGFASHILYQRWNPSSPTTTETPTSGKNSEVQSVGLEPHGFRVTFQPTPPPARIEPDIPLVQAREVEKIRRLTGSQARIRGRIFRVGHSSKSNTYFLNFGPSRDALTAVIFAPAVELFEKNKLQPKAFEGREIEVLGQIKDHPQYGLELILENPGQVKMLD
jgi:hypothetical protein